MIIDNAGTYTLRYTATDDCGKTTTVDRELVVEEPVYGVYWDGSSSSAWTKIGKSATLANPIPAQSNGTGSSPYDNIMPWSGMEIVEDAEVGTLVSIPKYYYKWTHGLGDNENGLQLEISSLPQEGFFTSPAHADRGDGVGERDIVYVGRYHCASDYKSTTGVQPIRGQKMIVCENGIHALGADIWQYDFAMYWTIAMLYLVEFADWNSQSKIGFGCSANTALENNGLTDAMQYHTGTDAASRAMYGQIQYRHIEGLWSNVADWCDGIQFDGVYVYVQNNPANNPNTGTLIGQREMGTATAKSLITPPQNYEYALYTNEHSTSGGFETYTCDQSNDTSNGRWLAVGGGYSKDKGSGLFYRNASRGLNDVNVEIGCRLMKLPSA